MDIGSVLLAERAGMYVAARTIAPSIAEQRMKVDLSIGTISTLLSISARTITSGSPIPFPAKKSAPVRVACRVRGSPQSASRSATAAARRDLALTARDGEASRSGPVSTPSNSLQSLFRPIQETGNYICDTVPICGFSRHLFVAKLGNGVELGPPFVVGDAPL